MVSVTQFLARLREERHARYREADLEHLWPALLREVERRGLTREDAVDTFLLHAGLERAWATITEEEIRKALETRKPANRGG